MTHQQGGTRKLNDARHRRWTGRRRRISAPVFREISKLTTVVEMMKFAILWRRFSGHCHLARACAETGDGRGRQRPARETGREWCAQEKLPLARFPGQRYDAVREQRWLRDTVIAEQLSFYCSACSPPRWHLNSLRSAGAPASAELLVLSGVCTASFTLSVAKKSFCTGFCVEETAPDGARRHPGQVVDLPSSVRDGPPLGHELMCGLESVQLCVCACVPGEAGKRPHFLVVHSVGETPIGGLQEGQVSSL